MKNKLLIVLSIVVVLCLSLAACTITSTYDIKFVNDDGTELATVKVDEDGEVAYNGQTPTKASTAEYDYVFAGWSDADGIALDKLPNATANATYKARYTSTKRSYEVKFVNGETTLQTSTLQYGAAIAYNGETPVKQATPSSTYAFVGWSLSEGGETVDITAATVVGNVTYYAVFSGTAVKYTVTWVVGETTSATEHEYEAAPVYQGTPTKVATDIARYEFAGWAKTADGDVVNLAEEKVVANITYYAVFTEIRTHYEVKFVNGETELQKGLVAKDAAPVYNGETPVKAMTEAETYTFSGWAKSADGDVVDLTKETITADGVVYYAVFTSAARMYDVYWKVCDETSSTKVAYNTAPVYDGTPTKAATDIARYEFAGWALSVDGETVNLTEQKITSEAVTYYAVFTEIRTHFAVKFVNGETELQNELVAKDAAPVYNGTTPVKASDESFDYTFVGWSKTDDDAIVDLTSESITADGIVYHAVFTATPRTATVTWHVRGEQTTSTLNYGETLVYGGTLSTADYEDDDYNYTFGGWSLSENGDVVSLDEVEFASTIDLYAVFNATIKQVKLTIKYIVEGSDEAIADKVLTLDKYTIYGKDTVAADGTTTLTADKSGYLADKPWVAGRLTADETVTVTYRIADVWDGTVATAYASGTGTAEDPYIIKTGAQLAYLSEQSRKQKDFGIDQYFKLSANIDLGNNEWTPICQRTNATASSGWLFFAGNFDGQDHIIKLKISSGIGVGLFEGLSGSLSNLTLQGSIAATHRAGAVAYNVKGKVVNVKSYLDIALTKDGKNCSYVGGFAGTSSGAKFENCANYGSISGTGLYVGGIVGASTGSCTYTNCSNYGSVTGTTNGVGGIAGSIKGETVDGCTNYGNIVGSQKIGGIVGADSGSGTIKNTTNYGKVSGSEMYVGGIAGTTTTTTITGCTNYGEVLYTGSGNSAHKGFSGIAGWVTKNSKITDCDNYGHVNGYSNVGGVAGYLGAGSTLDDACQNFGKVEGHDSTNEIIGANANK